MTILIAILSVYAFTGLAYLVRKNFTVDICPICVGVSLTWIWMLFGIAFLIIPNSFIPVVGILIAMSVLGIANKLEKRQYKFWQSPKIPNKKVEELKDKLENCC